MHTKKEELFHSILHAVQNPPMYSMGCWDVSEQNVASPRRIHGFSQVLIKRLLARALSLHCRNMQVFLTLSCWGWLTLNECVIEEMESHIIVIRLARSRKVSLEDFPQKSMILRAQTQIWALLTPEQKKQANKNTVSAVQVRFSLASMSTLWGFLLRKMKAF